jgi:hypothetical protein
MPEKPLGIREGQDKNGLFSALKYFPVGKLLNFTANSDKTLNICLYRIT